MRKTHFKKGSGSEFRGSLTTWPKSQSDLRNLVWHEIVQIPACTSHVAFCKLSTHEPVTNFTFFTSLYQTLTLNPYIKSHKNTRK